MTNVESTADSAALDRYAERVWRVELPIAANVDATTLRLVWLIAGFSVSVDRAAVVDYLCGLEIVEIARLTALDELVDGLLDWRAVLATATASTLSGPRTETQAPSTSGR